MNKDQVITRIKHNSMYRDDRETADYIIKALEQNTVSQETYDSEYLARKQAEHKLYEMEQNTSDDCVSRQAMLDAITEIDDNINMDIYTNEVREIINELSPVTPKILTCNDCVSRADVFQMIKDIQDAGDCFIGYYTYDRVKNLPPVAPARKVPREDITEDEVRINMLELALNQAKEHAESIEVLIDNHRLIFKAEKRGNRNENISRPYAK